MRLRPHHLADIFKHYGNGRDLSQPHPYGHAQHEIAGKVLSDPGAEIEFVLENDDICAPCRHLGPGNLCSDVLRQCSPPVSKQSYNDGLDARLFGALGMKPGDVMTAGEFLELLLSKAPGVFAALTHPGADEEYTATGLTGAWKSLGPKVEK